ncbi:MAG: hypothetical protein AAF639_18535 [Chloroflexota bacterium]
MKRQRVAHKHEKLMKSFAGEMTYRLFILGVFAAVVGSLVTLG